jgi:threonine dehydrogenase-like Zn-dependent dehydrogenase
MKAVVFHGVGDIRIETVADPSISEANDAVVRITTAAICGTDLHMIRGTMPGMQPGTVLGHEGVGVVEDVGKGVRNLKPGDRVVVPSTIACGYCSYCRSGYFAQCDHANPNGPAAGTAFFGGPKTTGPFQGLQAEYARVPYANVGLVKLPSEVTDDQAILLSDIFPTAHFGADLAEIRKGNTVAVFGCGPVGQFAIISAFLKGAGRVIAIDNVPSRLDMARRHGAECVNFDDENPVEAIRELTGGIGVDRTIDAVGIDAEAPSKHAHTGTRTKGERESAKGNDRGRNWVPGNKPTQALEWATEAVAKAGTVAIIGVYPETEGSYPIGKAMNKNLTVKMGNCNHRAYIPELVGYVREGLIDPTQVLTQDEPLESAIEAYKNFDLRKSGWTKVALNVAA